MRFEERTSKKKRQALLDEVLEEETEKLRKKCFPWQKRKFLLEDVEIRESVLEPGAAGRYDYKDNRHFITISKMLPHAVHKMLLNWLRNNYLNDLRITIQHELIHAFVNERYGKMYGFEEVDHDASPVFLSVLNWCNAKSNHKCAYQFKKSKTYIEIMELKKMHDLDMYIINMLNNYKKAITDLENIQTENKGFKILKEFLVSKNILPTKLIGNPPTN